MIEQSISSDTRVHLPDPRSRAYNKQYPTSFSVMVIDMALSKVVIVGRPNVGKSSVFNWLAGRRIAIVDAMAGVTRDRVGSLVQLGDDVNPRFIELFDTGGVGIVDRDDLSEDVERQIDTAMNEADLILFVVDIRDELMPLDVEVAHRLRYLKTPVILVMNKADVPEFDPRGAEFYKLGRGKPIAVSVHQNRNKKQLLQLIEEMLPPADAEKPADTEMKIAVVGRPNTGKSTFINTLARAERMIVSERPGTTRDSVDVHFELDNLHVPGDRHRRDQAQLEDPRQPRLLLGPPRPAVDPPRRRRAPLHRPHAGDHPARQATRRLHRQEHKPCIFTINKWDLMQNDPADPSLGNMGRFANLVQHSFRSMSYMPMAFITAQTGKNVKALVNLSQSLFKQSRKRVSTGTLNRILREAVDAHPPSSRENRTPRIYYATQVGVTPPTVVLFVNSTKLFDRPISATCSTSFARNCRSATSRSSSTCDPAAKPRKPHGLQARTGKPPPTGSIEPGPPLANAPMPAHSSTWGRISTSPAAF